MELIPFAKVFRKTFYLFLLVVLASCSSVKWSAGDPDAAQMMADISYLADDKLEGRTFGSKGETA
jgi:hypothetical protein